MAKLLFTEDSRVKVPVILHLIRLGYDFVPKKQWSRDRDERTNILRGPFAEAFMRLNPGKTRDDAFRFINNTLIPCLDNDDLGRQFYDKLINPATGERMVDFDDFDSNCFQVATEVDCTNENKSFRPDITLFINGLPLAFYEVKPPNNRDQMYAEYERMGKERNPVRAFRRFLNITQLMLFTGNQEYSDDNRWQGSFYCTGAKGMPAFNFFREKNGVPTPPLREVPDAVRKAVLMETNTISADSTPELLTACSPTQPGSAFATSLLSRQRLAFFLRFGIVFVNKPEDGVSCLEKHIMRYPQFFASLALRSCLDAGKRRGIIWHTQGSGKTALAYFTVRTLRDYYRQFDTVPKFFFVVDRLDLADQAADELGARGLHIVRAESKRDFARLLANSTGGTAADGEAEINIINIQRFATDGSKMTANYGTRIQRVFFIDEAHRSYDPKGSFLAALISADPDAVFIGLTGTPRLVTPGKDETEEQLRARNRATKNVFGGYIDTYYYNQSIRDGYTLRLIHEVIETKYRMQLEQALRDTKVISGAAHKRGLICAHPNFVKPLTRYIVQDLIDFRRTQGDDTLGGMIVCDSSEQARAVKEELDAQYADRITSALILHNEGTKEERRRLTEQFKSGSSDLLVVYNMLLTGFDSSRLKKLYMGRRIKDHSLLQTLARVNRPYKNMRFGYVVDFADIQQAFDAANAAYLRELKEELGGDWENFDNFFMTREEILEASRNIKKLCWQYRAENLTECSALLDTAGKKELQDLHRVLQEARSLKSAIIAAGYTDISTEELERFIKMDSMVTKRLHVLCMQDVIAAGGNADELISAALNSLEFAFCKTGENEMIIGDALLDRMKRALNGLRQCFDRKDAAWTNLYEEFKRIFEGKNFREMSEAEVENLQKEMDLAEQKLQEIRHREAITLAAYHQDAKYARLHRYLLRTYPALSPYERSLCSALNEVKARVDEDILNDSQLVQQEDYFRTLVMSTVFAVTERYLYPSLDIEQVEEVAENLCDQYLAAPDLN